GVPLVALRTLPALESYLNARAVAEAVNAVAPAGTPIVTADAPPPSFRLYQDRNLVPGSWLAFSGDSAARESSLSQAIGSFRASDSLAYVVFHPRTEGLVARAAPGPLEIVIRTPSLILARIQN